MIRLGAILACLTGAFIAPTVTAAEPQTTKSIRAIVTDTPPVIDGRLDDPVWKNAAIVEDLHEVDPNEFAEPSQRSRFYVLYDQQALYIAGRLWESNPEDVVAQVMRKGDWSPGDDSITILLDPHNNGRSGYMFDLNPNALRNEALFRDVTLENWDWEGIWHGAASKNSEGWVAELEIPFKTLSFDPGNDTWGINFSRWRGRSGELHGWVSRNHTMNPANSGKLEGLVGLQQGRGLDIVPGIRISENKDFVSSRSHTEVEPSIDLFYKLTAALTTSLTVNTDFSGTGADTRQINLSRFNLFFPERRDFFLQDTDIFEFGRIASGNDFGFTSTISDVELESGRPFFSRRIGLSDSGEKIGLEVGGKLTGRVGRWEVGILDIQQGSHADAASSNLFVGRIASSVLAESMLGLIVTNGDPLSDLDNSLIGMDFRYLNTRLAGGGTIEGALWYQRTDTEGLQGDDAAFGASLLMPNNEGLRGGIRFRELQANFNPALGFVNRAGVRDYIVEFGNAWIPDGRIVRSVYSGIDAQRVDTIGGELESQLINVRVLEIQNTLTDKLKVHYTLSKERLVEAFEISDGIFIQPGDYSFNEYCASIESGEHRALAVSTGVCDGEFYDGDSTNGFAKLMWRPTPHFNFVFLYDVNDIELPQGDFITRLTSLRADVAFSIAWSWENFIQYDNVSDSLGLNSILRWLPRAGREMVFVVNREFRDYTETRSFESFSSDIAFRFSYTFRF